MIFKTALGFVRKSGWEGRRKCDGQIGLFRTLRHFQWVNPAEWLVEVEELNIKNPLERHLDLRTGNNHET
jgi:hypothetical protein